MQVNRTLASLHLRFNDIKTQGAVAIGDALKALLLLLFWLVGCRLYLI